MRSRQRQRQRPLPAVRLAPLTPADAHAVAALFAQCSVETRRLRFFGNVSGIPPTYLAAVLAGRPERHDALGAWRGRDLVGLASLAAEGSDSGELAVLVADDEQGRGLGTRMIRALVRRAAQRGMTTVTASVLPGRGELLTRLARQLPLESTSADADVVSARFRIGELP